MKQLLMMVGISAVFIKSDRIWDENSGEVQADDILIQADKTPNLTGIKEQFPRATDVTKMKSSTFSHVFVWGANAPAEKIGKAKVMMLATVPDTISAKAEWLIAGQTPAEKHGSFTNFQGMVQTFRRALRGDRNVNDLDFLVDVIKALGEEPLGRTADEVRAAM